jgi:hypothetical protein
MIESISDSPKFRCNLLGESEDRVMQNRMLTPGSCFPILSGEGGLTAWGGLTAPGSSGESFDFDRDLLVACWH